MLFISYSCTNDDTKINENQSMSKAQLIQPNGIITAKRAKELDANWTATRVQPIKNAIGKLDNRSVRFTLEDMRNYLDFAENEAKTLGYNMDGIRVYFGAYGDNETNGKAGQATVFLVPTGDKMISEASMLFFQSENVSSDIPNAPSLNMGEDGNPPEANYPQ